MRPFFLFLPLSLFLSACSASPAPQVAPPLVITVVVTPTPSTSGAEAGMATPVPPYSQTSSYPAPFQTNITAVYQSFERGFMIYLSDRQAVWVFMKSYAANTGGVAVAPNFGLWAGYPDTFKEGDAEDDPSILAPAGFLQPHRGFGKVWREHPDVRDALGWASDYERPYAAIVTDYSIGSFDAVGAYTPQSFIHAITTVDGSLVHVDEAAGVWTLP
ncbi:MAG: hypothetical protein AAB342_01855 [Chloroflexota bacterium]